LTEPTELNILILYTLLAMKTVREEQANSDEGLTEGEKEIIGLIQSFRSEFDISDSLYSVALGL
jgi:hypothetical protein